MTATGQERTAIIVLGMHRSGTSALTGALGDFGISLPADAMAGNDLNPRGFMESDSITALNEELMCGIGTAWFDWRPLDIREADHAVVDPFRERAVAAVQEVFGDAGMFVLKDPRISRLVPFWTGVLAEAEVRAVFACIHRHPREVAASLDKWAGYAPAYGMLLWLRYVLDGEAATRGMPRAFTSYSMLLKDWQDAVRQIGASLDLGIASHQGTPSGGPFVDGQLRRSRSEEVEAGIPNPWAQTAFDVLERWAGAGENEADYATLDRLRDALDDASSAFGEVVDSGRQADILARRVAATHEESRHRIAEAARTIQQLHHALKTKVEECIRLQDRLETTQASLADSERQRLRIEDRLTERREEEAQARHRLASLAANLAKAEQERVRLEEQLTEQREAERRHRANHEQHLARAREHVDQLKRLTAVDLGSHIASAIRELTLTKDILAKREAEHQQLQAQVMRLRGELDESGQAEAELARVRAELGHVGSSLERAEHQLKVLRGQSSAELRTAVADSLRALAEARTERAELQGRLVKVRRQHRRLQKHVARLEEVEREFGAIVASRSWRFTSPLRRVVGWLRRRQAA